MTNLQGNASVLLTLGNKTGTYIVNAEIDTVPIVSLLTATAGKRHHLLFCLAIINQLKVLQYLQTNLLFMLKFDN